MTKKKDLIIILIIMLSYLNSKFSNKKFNFNNYNNLSIKFRFFILLWLYIHFFYITTVLFVYICVYIYIYIYMPVHKYICLYFNSFRLPFRPSLSSLLIPILHLSLHLLYSIRRYNIWISKMASNIKKKNVVVDLQML